VQAGGKQSSVSEEYVASIFRVEEWPELCLLSVFALVSCSAYSSPLKMQVICCSVTSVDFQRTTRRYIPEDITLHK
jgi:hypothetical protein